MKKEDNAYIYTTLRRKLQQHAGDKYGARSLQNFKNILTTEGEESYQLEIIARSSVRGLW